jgi:CheY-like chemotaxis protein
MAKVLVVDDDVQIRRIITDTLTANNHKVVTANDGTEGVSKALAERPDIIFMDLFMPKMDGYAALQAIKKEPTTENIPIVMVTAIGHELNKKLAGSLGSSGYITKPFTTKILLDTVTSYTK